MKLNQYKKFVENIQNKINDELLNVFIDRLDDAKSYDSEDELINSILVDFIYYDDQWEIMKAYSVPSDNKTYDECCEMFMNDLYSCLD